MMIPSLLWGEFLVRPVGLFVGAFGEKFREERERRGFTLDDVSNVTKISSRMLQAIEQERFDVLPGGVFNKGFIRAYAKTLGFNPEEAISEYLKALRQAQLDAQNAAWDQPLPQKTAPPGFEPSPKLVTSTAKSSNASGTKLPASVELATPVPAIALSQEPGRSASLQSADPAIDEFPLPKPLVQPPPQPQAVPPPLWISPPSSPKRTSPPQATEPPAVLQSAFGPPPSAAENPPARQEAGAHEMQLGPQVLIEESPSAPTSDLAFTVSAEAAPVAAFQPPGVRRWKIPGLILAFGALVIVAILWMRHPRQVALVAPPVKTDASASAQAAVAVPASSSVSNKGSSSNKAKPSTEPGADSHVEPPAAAVAATTKAGLHAAAKAQAPAPFRVAIRVSENCWISVTADGTLVSREKMIAPANTSVKASHEIIVQVSNPAAISFLWNDRPVSERSVEANAGADSKTFIFDNAGLRNGSAAGDSVR